MTLAYDAYRRYGMMIDGTTPVCELSGSGQVTAVNQFGANGLISRLSGPASVFYAFDERGNVAHRVSGSGSVLSSDVYDAYGLPSTVAVGDVWGYEAANSALVFSMQKRGRGHIAWAGQGLV